MLSKRTTLPVDCAYCGVSFVPNTRPNYVQRFCGNDCAHAARIINPDRAAHRRAYYVAWLAPRKAAARAFVDEVNAQTVCAHCGARPIEWHNPDHVLKSHQRFRICVMVCNGQSIDAIRAEMDRCAPLCRRCHMVEDGRMQKLLESAKENAKQAFVLPRPCVRCSQLYKPLRGGLCGRCYDQTHRPGRNHRKA